MLTVTKTMDGDVVVLHLAGRLDGQTENTLTDFTQSEHKAGTRFLLLDISKVDMLTSAGLRSLHTIYKLYSPKREIEEWENKNPNEPYKSAYFKLAGAAPEIYYILNIAGFLHNIPLFADLNEGLQSFKK